jgi:hypothetical protein
MAAARPGINRGLLLFRLASGGDRCIIPDTQTLKRRNEWLKG